MDLTPFFMNPTFDWHDGHFIRSRQFTPVVRTPPVQPCLGFTFPWTYAVNSFDQGKSIVIPSGSFSPRVRYSISNVLCFTSDETGVFGISMLCTFSQGMNTEDVNQPSGIVSENTTPLGVKDTFLVRISSSFLMLHLHLPMRYLGKPSSKLI